MTASPTCASAPSMPPRAIASDEPPRAVANLLESPPTSTSILLLVVWAALGDTYPADPATQHQHPCGGCAGCAGVFDSEKTVVNGSLPQNALLYRKESQAAISGQRRHLRACVRDAAAFVAVQGQRLSKVPSLTAHARLARCRKRGVRVIRLLRCSQRERARRLASARTA